VNLKKTVYVASRLTSSNRAMFCVLIAIITLLVIDISLVNVNRFITSQSLAGWRTTFFIALAVVGTGMQLTILRFVKSKSEGIKDKKKLHLYGIHWTVTFLQYVLIGILILTVLQIMLNSQYNIYILVVIIGISYTLGVILMGILAERFFSWFKLSKNIVVLLYGLSSTVIALNLIFTIIYVVSIMPIHLEEIRPHTTFFIPYRPAGSIVSILDNIYVITSVTSFMITWIATAMLLRHYSQRLGRIKYWVILGIPLVYFLIQFQPLFLNLFYQSLQSDPMLFSILSTLIFTFSKPIGGILFGIAFWTTTRSLKKESVVRDFITISAYGLILLFVTNQAIVLVTVSYPPFGLVTISFVGLASYLVLVGIYSSTISVSEDIKIRQSIRRLAMGESRLLDSIGFSHMEQEVMKRVVKITKEISDTMEKQTGVEASINENDMKEYLYEVLKEVKRSKENRGHLS